MLSKKPSSSDKKRKHAPAEDKHEIRKRRSTESTVELESKDDLADPELDRIGSDIEEGGLDLTMQFQPITAYVSDKKEMLQQCFRVLGERKLCRMLPDELKGYSVENIKTMCWEQLEPISEPSLIKILAGEELTSKETLQESVESQQDNNVDSTSCHKDVMKNEETKEVGASSEESDVLSINADTYDSDIEAPKDEQSAKTAVDSHKETPNERVAVKPKPVPEPPVVPPPNEPKKDIQNDIDRSVSEILSFAAVGQTPPVVDQAQVTAPAPSAPASGGSSQPSLQQLELLELEMRARAIKALMKANKKTTN